MKVAFRDSAPGAAPARATSLVIIPKNAVQTSGDRDYVFVIAGGRAERRAITVTATQDQEVTVGAGVAAGESVALNPPPGLADGAAVRTLSL